MTVVLLKSLDKATGNLNAGINASVLSIPLESGDGAAFPQPYTGAASSTGSRTVLNDTGDLGDLEVDDFIRNVTDGSWAFVTSISGAPDSITTTRLQGGSDNTWTSGDVWRSGEFVATLAAIDADGNDTAYEEVLISNRSTDTLTVPTGGRGYNGTIAQSFLAGDYVQLRVTAPYHEEIRKLLKELQVDTDSSATTLAALIADLAAVTNGDGASLVGIEDAGAYFSGATVESALQQLGALSGVTAGVLMMWATDSAPSGWLLCYGQAVSRTTYATLFAVISTTFGVGDGSTTFNLPDLRGRVVIGQDDMGGSGANRVTAAAADSIGGTGGAETHTLDVTEIPSHTHPVGVQDDQSPGGTGINFAVASSSGGVTGATGGGGAHNNLQPYMALNFIIKT